jgi:hypothetical protein
MSEQISLPPAPTPQTSRVWSVERAVQLIVLLVGGGIGGVIGTVLTNAIEWRRLTQQAEIQNASFVDKYLNEVINKDIHVRFRIAEYFGSVLESERQRDLWKAYLGVLQDNYNKFDADYFEQVKKIDPTSDELPNFQANRRLKRIESYLGEARELKIKSSPGSVSEAVPAPNPVPATKIVNSEYQVFTQFAGSLQREQVRSMMQALAKENWNMQGVTGGGERTPAAAGVNEIRYTAVEDKAAADELAKSVQKSGLTSRSVISSFAFGIRPKTLEIWISK